MKKFLLGVFVIIVAQFICAGVAASVADSWITDDGHSRTISVSCDPKKPSYGVSWVYARVTFKVADETGPVAGAVISFPGNAPVVTRRFRGMTKTDSEGHYTVDINFTSAPLGGTATSIRVLVDGVERLDWILAVSGQWPRTRSLWAGTISGTATETGGGGYAESQGTVAFEVSLPVVVKDITFENRLTCSGNAWSGGKDSDEFTPGSVGGATASGVQIMALDVGYGEPFGDSTDYPTKLTASKTARPDLMAYAYAKGGAHATASASLSSLLAPKTVFSVAAGGDETGVVDTKKEPIGLWETIAGNAKGVANGINSSGAVMFSVPSGKQVESMGSASINCYADIQTFVTLYTVPEVP